jgi:hypothetical protein
VASDCGALEINAEGLKNLRRYLISIILIHELFGKCMESDIN